MIGNREEEGAVLLQRPLGEGRYVQTLACRPRRPFRRRTAAPGRRRRHPRRRCRSRPRPRYFTHSHACRVLGADPDRVRQAVEHALAAFGPWAGGRSRRGRLRSWQSRRSSTSHWSASAPLPALKAAEPPRLVTSSSGMTLRSHQVGIPLDGLDEARVVIVVGGGIEVVDMLPTGGVGKRAPLGLAVAFAGAVDDQAVLRDLGLVEVRSKAFLPFSSTVSLAINWAKVPPSSGSRWRC